MRSQLFALLTRVGDEIDRRELASYLEHPDPTLRLRAVQTLEDELTPELEERSTDLVANEPYWWASAAILARLADGKDEDSLEVLHEALDDPVRDVRTAAATALIERRDRRSLEPLLAYLDEHEPLADDHPALVLAQWMGREAVPILERELSSSSAQVRKLTLHGLGVIGTTEAVSMIASSVADPDESVAEFALRVLFAMGDERAIGAALGALAEDSEEAMDWLSEVAEADEAALSSGIDINGICWRRVDAGVGKLFDLCRRLDEEHPGAVWEIDVTEDDLSLHVSPGWSDPHSPSCRRVQPLDARDVQTTIGLQKEEAPAMATGERVRIVSGALIDGATWFEVKKVASPYATSWVREDELASCLDADGQPIPTTATD